MRARTQSVLLNIVWRVQRIGEGGLAIVNGREPKGSKQLLLQENNRSSRTRIRAARRAWFRTVTSIPDWRARRTIFDLSGIYIIGVTASRQIV
jgi:hypothetical protein